MLPDHTALPPLAQSPTALDDRWATEIRPALPPDLEAQAQRLGAFTRVRGVVCASDLLRALLAYVLCCSSLRHLGAWAVLLGLADLSEAAWRKRLVGANLWLAWLLAELLSGPPVPVPVPGAPRILLIDATTVRQPGVGGDAWRVHLAYDFAAGRLHLVVFGDRQSAEVLDHYALQAGDVVVADGGYGYRRAVAYAARQHAQVVLRICPTTFPLELAGGGAFAVGPWLRSGCGRIRERRWLYCRYGGRRYAVRLVAIRVGPAAAARALKHKQRKAQKRGRTLQAETSYLASWVLVVTTLPLQNWRAAEVAQLYRGRWQIELVFKRLKQLLGLDRMRVRRPEAAGAVVRATLIAWLLQEPEAGQLRAQLPQWSRGEQQRVSSWRLHVLLTEELAHIVRGQWTRQRRQECLPRLARYLCSSPQRRQPQEARLRRWLLERCERGRKADSAAEWAWAAA